jgi:uncharacterized protein (TIGR03435 family)
MIRRAFLSLAPVLLLAGGAVAQTPAAKAQFEVATVKPAPPLNPQAIMQGKMKIGLNVEGSRVEIGYLALTEMIQYAYKVKQHQLVAPDWARNERFDIVAKMPEGATKEQVPEMMQGLLAERFGLKFHKESREQSVFALIQAKGGSKLKESSTEPEAPPPADDKSANVMSFGGGQVRQSGNSFTVTSKEMEGKMKMTMVDGKMRMEFTKAKIEALTEMVTRFVGKPVVDQTELTGKYDIALEMSMQEMMNLARTAGVAVPGMMPGAAAPGGDAAGRPGDAASDPTSGGSIMTSLQSMGLKLESKKAPVDTIIVDKLEKAPTEN